MELQDILIIEDDPFHAKILHRFLVSLTPANIVVARNGREAFDAVQQSSPDLILCDLYMPDMDGVEFIRHFAQTNLATTFILTSSVSNDVQDSVINMARSYGIKAISKLPKPISKGALANALSNLQDPVSEVSSEAQLNQISPQEVRHALLRDEFEPFFQGHYCSRTHQLIGAEALVRWNHHSLGLLTPDKFLPAVFEGGLSYALSCKMLRVSLESAAEWHRLGHKIQIAINVSPSDMEHKDFADKVLQAIEQARFPANKLTLEVTEVEITRDLGRALDNMARLRMRGITISIDDFGTGYSSICQLINSPFSELKIDRLYIERMSESPKHFSALQCMINLGKSLDLKLVAEGIETRVQAKMMAKLGCDILQGYYFNKPMSSSDFIQRGLMAQSEQNTAKFV